MAHKLINFINILAWIALVGSGGLGLIRIIGACTYSKLEQALDNIRGIKRSWPIKWPALIFALSLAWVLAR